MLDRGQASDHLHVIIKGAIEEQDNGSVEAVLGPRETFDARAVIHGAAGSRFVAAEETLVLSAAQDHDSRPGRRNSGFAAHFYSEVSRKLSDFTRRQRGEGMDQVLRARVSDLSLHPPVIVDGATTIEEAGRAMRDAITMRFSSRMAGAAGSSLVRA